MERLSLISPIDGSVYVDRPAATSTELAAMMSRAKRAQSSWQKMPVAERVQALEAGVRILEAHADEAALELAWQMGRPIRYGAKEIATAASRARHMLSLAEMAVADRLVAPGRLISREPIGIVLVIAPWNYPYLTAINSIIPALASGNSVVLKHSFQTALVADRLAAAFASAGIPADVFQALHSSNAVTLEAVTRPEVGHVVFTGSVETGTMIALEATRKLKSVTLELGGKDAAYVRADADLDGAVADLVDGAYFNSGQSCCGIERIYVDRELFPLFVDRFTAEAGRLIVGNPLDPETTTGPMATARGAQIVRSQIADALAAGASAQLRQTCGGSGTDQYLCPEVLTDVTHDMSVMQDESFGPVVGIMAVADDDEALELIDDSRFGLTASIWSRDTERAAALADQIACGTVYQNRCDYLDPALPWSGRRDSGLGLSLSHLAYDSLTRTKSRLFEPSRNQTDDAGSRPQHAPLSPMDEELSTAPSHAGENL